MARGCADRHAADRRQFVAKRPGAGRGAGQQRDVGGGVGGIGGKAERDQRGQCREGPAPGERVHRAAEHAGARRKRERGERHGSPIMPSFPSLFRIHRAAHSVARGLAALRAARQARVVSGAAGQDPPNGRGTTRREPARSTATPSRSARRASASSKARPAAKRSTASPLRQPRNGPGKPIRSASRSRIASTACPLPEQPTITCAQPNGPFSRTIVMLR